MTLDICVHAKSLQSCLTLCDPMDYSLPGSSSQGLSRQEYWSGLSCPPPGNLPDPVWNLRVLCLLKIYTIFFIHFPGGSSDKELTCQCRRQKRFGFNPWIGRISWRRAWQPTLVFLPGESHRQSSLVGYSPWDHKESDMTELTQHAYNNNIVVI